MGAELRQEPGMEPSLCEEELIRTIQGGKLELYAAIVQRYQQRLYVYCYHLLMQREEAEDAVQDVFIKAYEKLSQYAYRQSFSAWLYKIAYHHCLNMLKRRRRRYGWTDCLARFVKSAKRTGMRRLGAERCAYRVQSRCSG